MITSSKQLKAYIRKLSGGNSTKAQIYFRNYIMERFLERISVSDYRTNFILKGGMLVGSLVGMDLRSTMDIDTTIKNLPLSVEAAESMAGEISRIDLGDNVSFSIKNVSEIMEEMKYAGVRVSMEATLETTRIPLKVDISTGDIITPKEIEYRYKLMFEERTINIMTYNLETVLAEKIETVISRSTANTRMKDFYDLHILYRLNGNSLDMQKLKAALEATSRSRNTYEIILNQSADILDRIEKDKSLSDMWGNYCAKYPYAQDMEWGEVISTIREMIKSLNLIAI